MLVIYQYVSAKVEQITRFSSVAFASLQHQVDLLEEEEVVSVAGGDLNKYDDKTPAQCTVGDHVMGPPLTIMTILMNNSKYFSGQKEFVGLKCFHCSRLTQKSKSHHGHLFLNIQLHTTTPQVDLNSLLCFNQCTKQS